MPHLIKDGGVFVEGADGAKDYSGTAMYVQAGIDKAFSGGNYTFDPAYSGIGSYFVAIALFFFAFTTILAYAYIAETNISYLTKKQSDSTTRLWINITRVLVIASAVFGAIKAADLAWAMGDLGVGLMAWCNVIAIWILHKPAVKALRDYERQKKEKGSGRYAVYHPDPKELPNATFWLVDYPERLRREKFDENAH